MGENQFLREFDKNYVEFKKHKYQNCQKQYKKLGTKLLAEVKSIRLEAKRPVQEWQKDFYLKHDRAPTYADLSLCSDLEKNYEKMNLCDEITRLVKSELWLVSSK